MKISVKSILSKSCYRRCNNPQKFHYLDMCFVLRMPVHRVFIRFGMVIRSLFKKSLKGFEDG